MIPRPVFVQTDDGVGIVYEVFGEGPDRLVYLPRAGQTLGYMWEIPRYARFLESLGVLAEVMVIDLRGVGMADRVVPDDRSLALEARITDVLAAMGDAGWEHASFLGVEDGGSLAALLAATHPARVDRLALYGAYARGTFAEDYPIGTSEDEWDEFLGLVASRQLSWEFWQAQMEVLAPSHVDDEEFCRRLLLLYLASAPSLTLWEVQRDVDIRAALPSIQAPTLVLDRLGNRMLDLSAGDYLAEHIPGARRQVVPGIDFEMFAGDQEPLLDALRDFLTGGRVPVPTSRVLSTVLFTDVVDSTAWASRHGDDAWRRLLERHDEILRAGLARFAGHEVDNAGDGFFATFDGPARAVQAALRLCYDVHEHLGVQIRAGVHTGEVELVGDRVRGVAVHIGARIASLAGPSEVLASSTVKDLTAGSGLTFADAGTHHLKGVDEPWHLYRVT